MTRLRMTDRFATGNDHPDGCQIVTFERGEEFNAAQKTGSWWWTTTDARTAFLIPDSLCVEVAS